MSWLSRVTQRVQLVIGKALIAAVTDTDEIQLVKVAGLSGEVQDGLEHVQPYGLTANPPIDSEAVVAYLQGNRDHGVVLVTDSGAYRVTGLASGEVAIYSRYGQKVLLNAAGEITVNDGTDYAVAYQDLKTAFDQLKSELNALVSAYNAHIHITTATVGATATPGVIAPTVSQATPPTADMSPAQVTGVRLP